MMKIDKEGGMKEGEEEIMRMMLERIELRERSLTCHLLKEEVIWRPT